MKPPPHRRNRGGAFEKWTVRLFVPLLFLALGWSMLAVLGERGPDWRAWFDGPERGNWRALTLDGEDVRSARLSITIQDGEIIAGHNGCNSWWKTEPDPVTGEQGYMSTLAACAELPTDRAYLTIAHGEPAMRLLTEDRLELVEGRHRGTFIRWTEERAEAEREADEREMERMRESEPSGLPVPTVPPPSLQPPPPPLPLPAPAPENGDRDGGSAVPPPVDVPVRLPPRQP